MLLFCLQSYSDVSFHFLMGSRLAVGHAALARIAGVRILSPQPKLTHPQKQGLFYPQLSTKWGF